MKFYAGSRQIYQRRVDGGISKFAGASPSPQAAWWYMPAEAVGVNQGIVMVRGTSSSRFTLPASSSMSCRSAGDTRRDRNRWGMTRNSGRHFRPGWQHLIEQSYKPVESGKLDGSPRQSSQKSSSCQGTYGFLFALAGAE